MRSAGHSGAGLAWPERVRVWDAALAGVRGYFRGQGLREVSTPVRVRAVALEPFIEPVAAPPGLLATSPELAMKRLLCRGSGSIFQVSHVFRRAEVGLRHSEEFHLVEWYRVGADLAALLADVAALVACVFQATGREEHVPKDWHTLAFLDAVEATCGARLAGGEDVEALLAALPPALAEATRAGLRPAESAPPGARRLAAWTAFFSAWSDMHFEPWLEGQAAVHVLDFPAPLAALARVREEGGRSLAGRAESHLLGVEIANGYVELADAGEQRRRFEDVAGLRAGLGLPGLPVDEEFLAELPDLPACVGMALGLDRLIMLASGRSSLDEVSLGLGGL